jgi:hydrogenase assembly chaperone HypC/HupF
MCLGIPGRVVEVRSGSHLARVDVAGVLRDIDVAAVAGSIERGDYILVHSGFALERMSATEARDALAAFGISPVDRGAARHEPGPGDS